MSIYFSKSRIILVTIFVIAFASQLSLWLLTDYDDEDLWQKDAIELFTGTPPNFYDDVLLHPGTAVLLPEAALIHAGIPSKIALNLTIALFTSICITIVCGICLFTRPQSLWWLGAAILLIFNPLFTLATMLSTATAELTVLLVAIVFFAREQKIITDKILIYLGCCAGVLLATRIDTGLAVCFFTFFYLVYLIRWKVWIFTLVAILSFFALDPYLWTAPVEHLSAIAQLVHLNVSVNITDNPGYTLRLMSLGVVTLLLGFLAFLRPHITSLRRDFFWYIAAMFLLVCTALSMASYRPMRYYFPFAVMMEIFLPLIVLDIIDRPEMSAVRIPKQWLRYGFLCALVVARAIPALILAI